MRGFREEARAALVFLASLFSGLSMVSQAGAETVRLSPGLAYLAHTSPSGVRPTLVSKTAPIALTLRFRFPPTDARIAELEALGLSFEWGKEGVRHLGPIYRVEVLSGCLSTVGRLPEIEWAESDWRPGLVPCLNVSRDEIRAEAAWGIRGSPSAPVDGRGILIADFDTGIDLFHPAFWFADGDTLEWVDVNGNRRFEPGVDGADFDGDGLIGPDEVLQFWDGKVEDAHGVIPNRVGDYEVDRDWLYRDLNGSGRREAGLGRGFSESDPTFGEPVFVVLDANGDNTLDLGERVVALGTCKVRAVLDPGAKERRRGRDLIWAERDERGHGTSVAGILVGESRGRLLSGVAPGAELLMANAFQRTSLSQIVLWALDEGADVMLYELGNWVWDYMDGSSNLEQMINLAAAKGAVQVVAAGNLAGSGKHFRTSVPERSAAQLRMRCPTGEGTGIIWGSVLWRTPGNNLRVRIRSPRERWVTLSGAGAQSAGGIRYWSNRGTSPRGTAGIFFSIETDEDLGGDWLVEIQSSGVQETVDGYVTDDRSGWTGGTVFLDAVSDEATVAWPANADSAIAVASYATREVRGEPGSLSHFSGRGARIDGERVIDLAAPGNYDIRTCQSGSLPGAPVGTYTSFGGTSASAAHVAGASALVLQANRQLGHPGVEFVFTESAVSDRFTGQVPNPAWGYGKLDVLAAVARALDIEIPPVEGPVGPSQRLTLHQNYPNPFNPLTTIRFRCEAPGELSLKIYDVHGRLVRVLIDRYLTRGEWKVHWDGTDGRRARVASGVYFCRLEARGSSASQKMLLLE